MYDKNMTGSGNHGNRGKCSCRPYIRYFSPAGRLIHS